jgi:hypothetical protein
VKYAVSILIILLALVAVAPSTAELDKGPTKPSKTTQSEIFSEKTKPSKCIDKIQVQQRTKVDELRKIKSLLKNKKD